MSVFSTADDADQQILWVMTPSRRRDGLRDYPGKRFYRNAEGNIVKEAYRVGAFFDAHQTCVSSLSDLDVTLRHIAHKRLGFPVSGHLRNPERTTGIRRLVHDRKDAKAALKSVPRPWLLFDLDKVPNAHGLNPRTQPEESRHWLLSLLPKSVQQADAIVRWSSSLCVGADGPPPTLSAHIWVWLSEPVEAIEAKSLLLRANALACAMLNTAGCKSVIDAKTTEAQQPIYVAPPLLWDGIPDPFTPDERQVLVPGVNREVDLHTLREELAAVALPVKTSRPKRNKKEASRDVDAPSVTPRRTSSRPALPLPETRSLGADHFILRQIKGLARKGAEERSSKRSADRAWGLGRMASELVRVALARVEWGKTYPAFAAWTAAGGVPDGERDVWLYNIAACLAHALPAEAIKAGQLGRLVGQIGKALCSEDWMTNEWHRGGYAKSVLEKAGAAARGDTVEWEGKQVDPRYRVSAARLRTELQIGDDEIRALCLLSLADGATLSANRRALTADFYDRPSDKPRLTPGQKLAKRQTVLALRKEGHSLRAIVAQTGVPIANVQRWSADAMTGGDPFWTTSLESSSSKEGESTSTESVQAAITCEKLGQAIFGASGNLVENKYGAKPAGADHDADGFAGMSSFPEASYGADMPVPSFILRLRADKKKAQDRAESYIAKVERLVANLAERCSEPLDELLTRPCLDLLGIDLRDAVALATERLEAAQKRCVLKVERQERRRAAEAERIGFWELLEARIGQDGVDALAEGKTRLQVIAGHWDGRIARARAECGRDRDDLKQLVLNLTRAKSAVLKAELRRFNHLQEKAAA